MNVRWGRPPGMRIGPSATAATVADSDHRIEAAHPGRFLLGIGVGHRARTPARGCRRR